MNAVVVAIERRLLVLRTKSARARVAGTSVDVGVVNLASTGGAIDELEWVLELVLQGAQ